MRNRAHCYSRQSQCLVRLLEQKEEPRWGLEQCHWHPHSAGPPGPLLSGARLRGLRGPRRGLQRGLAGRGERHRVGEVTRDHSMMLTGFLSRYDCTEHLLGNIDYCVHFMSRTPTIDPAKVTIIITIIIIIIIIIVVGGDEAVRARHGA